MFSQFFKWEIHEGDIPTEEFKTNIRNPGKEDFVTLNYTDFHALAFHFLSQISLQNLL